MSYKYNVSNSEICIKNNRTSTKLCGYLQGDIIVFTMNFNKCVFIGLWCRRAWTLFFTFNTLLSSHLFSIFSMVRRILLGFTALCADVATTLSLSRMVSFKFINACTAPSVKGIYLFPLSVLGASCSISSPFTSTTFPQTYIHRF